MSEGFLTRWSRRKRGGAVPEVEEAEVPPPAQEIPLPEVAAPVAVLACDLPPEPITAPPEDDTPPPDLPSLESLTAESDLTAFLRPGVPAPLRQAAMRRMWSLDTGIRDFCGPADYAWDYNVEGGVPGSSLSMAGNLRAMLAQVVGRTEAQLAAYDAGAADEDSGPPPDDTPAPEAPPAVAEASPPEPPAFVPPAVVAQAWPGAPAPVVTAMADPEPAPPSRRRHGSAMPV